MPGVFQPSDLALNPLGFFLRKKIKIALAIMKATLVDYSCKIKRIKSWVKALNNPKIDNFAKIVRRNYLVESKIEMKRNEMK
jgi:hypothetical protein